MPRARLIKHQFFLDEAVADCSESAQLLFIGLWTLADKEGRLEDKPRVIKAQIFPYRDRDVDALLAELAGAHLLLRYNVNGLKVIQIRSFTKHQHTHVKEPASELPAPNEHQTRTKRVPNKTGADPSLTEAEAESLTEAEAVSAKPDKSGAGKAGRRKPATAIDEAYLQELQEHELYKSLNVRRCYAECALWYADKGKTLNRQGLRNWLKREEQPAVATNGTPPKARGNAYVGAPSPPLPEEAESDIDTSNLTVDELMAILAEHEKSGGVRP